MEIKRQIGNIIIIVLFALLHSAVAIISRTLDYYDDIPLTVLTITMVIVVSMRNSTRVDMMAMLTLVATLLGYLTGTWLRAPIELVVKNALIAPAITTFIITVALGLGTNYLTHRTKRFRSTDPKSRFTVGRIVIVALSILVLRMGYVALDRAEIFTEGMLFARTLDVLGNTWALLLLFAGNIVLTLRMVRQRNKQSSTSLKHEIINAVLALIIPIGATLLVYYDVPYQNNVGQGITDLVGVASTTLLIDLIIITICYLIQLSLNSDRELRQERELKHRTEYQYERLKQQINPHFLFNSLGILDYLVQEHETERASAFIRKLAGIYRYMLNNDTKPLVKLNEELEFTNMYISLLKERFDQGMVVEKSIDSDKTDYYVVPCALQLLVENATKHNIVSAESPLLISITTEGEMLVVKNNLQPRTHGQPSTHLGLTNIHRQYLDITGKGIVIEKTDNEFIVKLPLV